MKKSLPKRTVNIICALLILLGLVILGLGEKNAAEALKWVGLIVLISFLPFRFMFLRCPHCYHYLDSTGKGNTCPWCGKELK